MPKADLQYSHGALQAASLGPLTAELTGLLLRHRGRPDTPQERANVWWFASEQQALVDGAPSALPLVMLTVSIFAGGMTAAAIEQFIADATGAVKQITPDARVWIVVDEVAADHWGVDGVLRRAAPPSP